MKTYAKQRAEEYNPVNSHRNVSNIQYCKQPHPPGCALWAGRHNFIVVPVANGKEIIEGGKMIKYRQCSAEWHFSYYSAHRVLPFTLSV